MGEPGVGAENAALFVMNENRIANGIEGIDPLLLDRLDLLKQVEVLDGGAQEIGDVDQIGQLILLEALSGKCADVYEADRAFLAAERYGDELRNSGLRHGMTDLKILFVLKSRDAMFFLE